MVTCLPVYENASEGLQRENRRSGCYQQVDKKYCKVWHFGNAKRKKAATYSQTEIIINTGISLRNKTMADNQRLF